MAKFCLNKQLADALQESARNGEINIESLADMNSAQRTEFFSNWADKSTAQQISGGFEEAMISDQQDALAKWVKKVFSGSKKVEAKKKDVLAKIDSLNESGVLTPANEDAFLSDLVATKLGVTVTAEEASTIATMSTKLEALAEQESEFGTPTIEYFKAKKEIENYLESLAPSSRLKVSTSISGRGAMLFSFKSPFLNIESNSIQAFLGGLERRVVSRNLTGSNSNYSKEYRKFVMKVFKESGYDVTRMRSLDSVQKVRGEEIGITAQGEGKARAVARFYEDIVFKKLMSAPDVAFSAVHFADSANLTSTQVAKNEGLVGEKLKARSLEIFKDATRVSPKTAEGKKVRSQAIADAEYGTYTNDSALSKASLGIRRVLNEVTGDFRLGDQLMPFVKTPANVISAGLDVSGVTIPIDLAQRTVKLVNEMRAGETFTEASQRAMVGITRKWVRAGFGITFAHILASLFDPEEFIGEYPTSKKEQELLRSRNATTNSVKIGDRWVSLDYFGALGSPLVGILYAKKYGDTTSEKLFNYYVGVGKQISKIPGLELNKDIYTTLRNTKFNTLEDNVGELQKSFIDYVSARTIPAFSYDVAKMTDEYERRADPKKPLQSIQRKIPVLSTKLEPKISVFGDKIKTESGVSILLFGSRVKTQTKSKVVDEMIRLNDVGHLPSISDSTITSTRMKSLKTQVGDEKFSEAQDYFRTRYAQKVSKLISTASYKRKDDAEKAKAIDKIKDDTLERTLKRYKFKKVKK